MLNDIDLSKAETEEAESVEDNMCKVADCSTKAKETICVLEIPARSSAKLGVATQKRVREVPNITEYPSV